MADFLLTSFSPLSSGNFALLEGDGPVVVFSEPVLAVGDEIAPEPPDTTIYVEVAINAVEDEGGGTAATMRAYSAAAAVEDEEATTAAIVRFLATISAVEDEEASATAHSNPPGTTIVHSEAALAVEDEGAASIQRVLAYAAVAAVEDEGAAASTWLRAYSSAAAVEDEAADVVEPEVYAAPLSATVRGWRPVLSATIRRT